MRGLLAMGLLICVARCDLESTPPDDEALVTETFLETGRVLPPVLLRRTTSLSEPDASENDAATGGAVEVVLDGQSIPYVEKGRAGRYVPTADSVVRPQRPWQLEARWQGDTVRAQGRVPQPITVAEVCVDVPSDPVQAVQVDSIRRDSLDIPATTDSIYTMDVTVRWESDLTASQADTNWVRTQLLPDASSFSSEVVSFFLEPITVRREADFQEQDEERTWSGVYAVPVDKEEPDLLPTHNLTTALVRGDNEFAAFAQTRTDPDQREPISNIDGGLGIATAVSVDSVRIESITEPGTERCEEP